jgi:hypothetical protein
MMSRAETVTVADADFPNMVLTAIDEEGASCVRFMASNLPNEVMFRYDLTPEAAIRLGTALTLAGMKRAQ